MTLLLSRMDLERVLDTEACLEALRDGFLAAQPGIAAQRIRTDLPGPGTATVLVPGLAPRIPAYTVKVNAKFPGSRPALRGVVCLHDGDSGEPLAVLDSATVTAWRTGLSAALATDALARPPAHTVAIIGAGAQSGLVIKGLTTLRDCDHLAVCDLNPSQARLLARRAGVPARLAADPRDAARSADIIVTAARSRTPLLDHSDVAPGAHITSLGADEPGKAELTPALLAAGRVIVDDVELALSSGALGTAALSAADIAGTLSQVLHGTLAGRQADDDITIYTPVGLPWQDLTIAWTAYHHATAASLGQKFDFLT